MKKLSLFLILLLTSALLINSCKKNENDDAPAIDNNGSGSANLQKTTLVGQVFNEAGVAINGVAITAYGQTAQTNYDGIFILKDIDVDASRCLVKFTKSGFFNRTQALKPTINSVNYLKIVLISNTQTQSISAITGGTVTLPDNSSVQFAPNSFITVSTGAAYTGTVQVALKHLSPDAANFGYTIPGGDLLARDVNDNEVVLYTYGMLGVQLTGSGGEALQLAANTTATIKVPIASVQMATAPTTLPLWYFDETASLWKEQGTATKVGNNYVGSVTHFSWWNYDYQGPKSAITGKVIDCMGDSLPNVVVTINGWYQTTTDQNGVYFDYVPVGMTFNAQALGSNNNNMFLDSQIEYIPTLTANQVYTVPDLIVSCPSRVAGALKSCTGANSSGLIFINDGSHNLFLYTTTGNFNIMMKENTQASFTAFSAYGSFTDLITSLPQNQTLTVGDLILCDSSTATPSNNWFILNGAGFTNRLFAIDTIHSQNVLGTLTTYCSVSGYDHVTGLTCEMALLTNGNTIGSYPYGAGVSSTYIALDVDGNFSGSFDLITQIPNVTPSATGVIEVVRYDATPGNRIIMQFSGTILPNYPNSIPVNVSGQINVARRQ